MGRCGLELSALSLGGWTSNLDFVDLVLSDEVRHAIDVLFPREGSA